MIRPIVYVGIDPGIDPGVTGAITFMPGEGHVSYTRAIIIPCPGSVREMASLFKTPNLDPACEFCVVLEWAGSHGQEGRATLATFITNYGEWRGILASLEVAHRCRWECVTPQVWQKPYRDRLPVNPKKPQSGRGPTGINYTETKIWRRELGKVQSQRKKELYRIAAELGAPLKPLTIKTADSYLLAVHARDYME